MRYGDHIDMEVRVIAIGRTSITWGYRAGEKDELVVEGSNVSVCLQIDTFEKMDVPEWLRQSLTAYMQKTSEV